MGGAGFGAESGFIEFQNIEASAPRFSFSGKGFCGASFGGSTFGVYGR